MQLNIDTAVQQILNQYYEEKVQLVTSKMISLRINAQGLLSTDVNSREVARALGRLSIKPHVQRNNLAYYLVTYNTLLHIPEEEIDPVSHILSLLSNDVALSQYRRRHNKTLTQLLVKVLTYLVHK